MKVGEILRKMADVVDAEDAAHSAMELTQQSDAESQVANSLAQQAADDAMSQCNDLAPDIEIIAVSNDDDTDTATMVPPLQQKHELLKMATGVENEVDDFAELEDDNELEMMKKMAGIGSEQLSRDVSNSLGPVEINPRKNAAMIHFASDNYDAE